MSSCPTRDIHSVYLDNEMPEIYKAEYESHLQSCPECQKTLAGLKQLKNIFAADSKSLNLDSTYLESSFARLQVKKSYSKNLNVHEKKSSFTASSFKFAIPVAAAAAAVFALIIPLRINTSSAKMNTSPAAVASVISKVPVASANSLSSGSGKVISGNISRSVLYSSAPSARRGNISTVAVNVDSVEKELIREMDVFRPTFENRAHFKVEVPDMGSVPIIYSYQNSTTTTGHN